MDRLGRAEGYDIEQRIREVQAQYSTQAGQELTPEEAREEITADSMLDVIGTRENMEQLMKQSKSTAEKIKEWITNTYQKFKDILNRLARNSPEVAALKDDVDYLGRISSMWQEGMRQAAEAWRQAQVGYNDGSAALEQNQAVQQYRQEMQGDMTVDDRENSLTAFLAQLFMDTQGQWVQAHMDEYEEGLAKYRQALLEYKRGGVALNVALERAGLSPLSGNDIRVASYAADQVMTQEGAKERANARALADDLEKSDGAESYGDHMKFSLRVTNKNELDFLDNQETVKTYKTMQLVDGKLYPPMAAVVAGSMEDHSVLGQWEKATEHPELIKNGNKFTLNKGRGKGSIDAAYNPYMHSSNLMINDQFSGAYNRPDLVTVECEVPVSELDSGYHAEYAKDSVGWHSWHTGTVAGQLRNQKDVERQVLLSRWIKPVRIVSNSEVAQHYAELLEGTDIAVPDNVVPPALLAELEKAGVKIKESGKVKRTVYSLPARKYEAISKENQNNIRMRGEDYADTEQSLLNHINIALSSSDQKRIHIGAVSEETKKKIESDTGWSIFKDGQYTFSIGYDDIRHLKNRHYNTPSDILEAIHRVYDMINSYDDVRAYTDKGQTRIEFKKTFPEAEYLTINVASKKARSLETVTVYLTKKNRGQVSLHAAANNSGNLTQGSPSNKIINNAEGKVNGKFSLPSQQRQEADAAEWVRDDAELYAQLKQDPDARAALWMIERIYRNTTTGEGRTVLSEADLNKRLPEVVKRLKEQTGATVSNKEMTKQIMTLWEALQKPGYQMGEMMQYARNMIKRWIESAPGMMAEQDETTKEILQALKHPFSLTPDMKSEIKGTFGDARDFYRKNFGKLKISNKALSTLADVWTETLNRLNPGVFTADATEADMPIILDAWLETAGRREYSGDFGANIGAMSTDMAMNTMDEHIKIWKYKKLSPVGLIFAYRFAYEKARESTI